MKMLYQQSTFVILVNWFINSVDLYLKSLEQYSYERKIKKL